MMMRLLAALPLLALASAHTIPRTPVARAAAPAPSAPTDPQYNEYCAKYTQGDLANLVCPVDLTVAATLQYQAGNTETSSDALLTTLFTALENPNLSVFAAVVDILKVIGGEEASQFLYSVAAVLDGAAAVIYSAYPKCICNIQLCNYELVAAKEAAAANTDAQSSCENAKYYCGAFYSGSDVNAIIPACAAYTGTTGASN